MRIFSKSGEVITGQLLSVRPDELPVCTAGDIDDAVLALHTAGVARIHAGDIDRIGSEGHSNFLRGVGIGTLAGFLSGLVVGGIVGAGDRDSWGPSDGAVVGGLLFLSGPIIGGTLGLASSSGEINIEHPEPDMLMQLNSAARYSEGEPPFLYNLKWFAQSES